ncbi:DUF2946 family protein [Cupriavidus basilensis]|uniref:DUF2946 family protein n=1 Tax=Cupriavidus basilensis TaxID=68895 RepID=UPI00346470D6
MSHPVPTESSPKSPFGQRLATIISHPFFRHSMSFAHRLILWLALLGMALHAPWPMMAHAQSAEGMVDHTICSASGIRVVSVDDQTSTSQDIPGSHQSLDDSLCCLVCADLGGTVAIPHVPFVFQPHLRQLGLVRPVLQPDAYRPPGILRATARAPPSA